MDYAKMVKVFRAAAVDAGQKIMEFYGTNDIDVHIKPDATPVTQADKAADTIITTHLRAAFPKLALVTEEQVATHNQRTTDFIIVDPLDGTKEFMRQQGDFTVNIAWVEHGVPMRGVVYAPARKRLFYTDAVGQSVEETGPFNQNAPGPVVPIFTSVPDNQALRVVASKSHRDTATNAYINKHAVTDIKSAGSSLKFCLVATGEADFYPRLGRTMEWDTAAGDAVLRGAGGRVIGFNDHDPLTYGKRGFENGYFIAHAPGVELRPA